MFVGTETAFDPRLSKSEKLYIRFLGVPINGLRIRARRILPMVSGTPKRVLDAGCGVGVFCFEMAKKLKESRILGIDSDEEQIRINNKIALTAGLKNCHFQTGNVCEFGYREQFDMVLCVDVIEHIENDVGVCRGLFDALTEGGKLIMHVPAKYRRWIFFRKRLNFWKEKDHARPGYTLEEITGILEEVGFVICLAKYTYGWLETVTNNISNIISRSKKENKYLYALAFPILSFISYWGQFSNPGDGSGILVVAEKGRA